MIAPLASLRRLANPWLLLAAIFVGHALANYLWLSADRTFRSFDMGPHIEFQANAYAVVAEEGLGGLLRVARGYGAQVWPSAGYLPSIAFGLLFGQGLLQLRIFNLFYLALLMTALFLTGRRIHSARAGLLAAALVSFYPLVYGDSRQFGIDLPGAACAALGVYLMLCTERLSRPWRSLGLGAACGAGLLLCPRIALLLLPAAACLLLVSLRAPRGTTRPRVLLHAALGLAAAGALSACWWWGRLGEMAQILGEHKEGLEGSGGAAEPSALFYLNVLPWALSPYLVLMAALALVLLLRRRGAGGEGLLAPERLLLPLVWLAAGLLSLSVIQVRHMRHMLPLVPVLALLTGVGLSTIPQRRIRRLVIGLALGVAATSWLLDSFVTRVDFNWPGAPSQQAHTLRETLDITSGPPARNPVIVAAEEVGRVLRGWHGSGRGVVLRVDPDDLNDPWRTRAVLSNALPGLRIVQSSYKELIEDESDVLQMWRNTIARSITPPRHCYHVVFMACPRGGCSAPPPDQRWVALKEVLARWIKPVKITLWRRARCLPDPEKG